MDPSSRHIWFEALGGLIIIAAVAAFFVIAVVRAERKPIPEVTRHTPEPGDRLKRSVME
jgi:hypothetical protein